MRNDSKPRSWRSVETKFTLTPFIITLVTALALTIAGIFALNQSFDRSMSVYHKASLTEALNKFKVQ